MRVHSLVNHFELIKNKVWPRYWGQKFIDQASNDGSSTHIFGQNDFNNPFNSLNPVEKNVLAKSITHLEVKFIFNLTRRRNEIIGAFSVSEPGQKDEKEFNITFNHKNDSIILQYGWDEIDWTNKFYTAYDKDSNTIWYLDERNQLHWKHKKTMPSINFKHMSLKNLFSLNHSVKNYEFEKKFGSYKICCVSHNAFTNTNEVLIQIKFSSKKSEDENILKYGVYKGTSCNAQFLMMTIYNQVKLLELDKQYGKDLAKELENDGDCSKVKEKVKKEAQKWTKHYVMTLPEQTKVVIDRDNQLFYIITKDSEGQKIIFKEYSFEGVKMYLNSLSPITTKSIK